MLVNTGEDLAKAAGDGTTPAADLNLTLQDIWNGIAQDEFFPHYQPKVVLKGMELVGVEALMRWRHPEHGLLTADDFREFACDNAIRLHGGMNPRFFEGTAVEDYARGFLR